MKSDASDKFHVCLCTDPPCFVLCNILALLLDVTLAFLLCRQAGAGDMSLRGWGSRHVESEEKAGKKFMFLKRKKN